MNRRILFLLILAPVLALAQVGIDTKNPEQTLHVEGKVKIADDDTLPTRGTMRFSSEGDFEGFSGKGWVSLTQQGGASLPSNPVPVYGYLFAVSVGQASTDVTLERFIDNTDVTTVPAGKFLLITSLHVEPNGGGQSGLYEVSVGRSNGNALHVQSALRVSGSRQSQLFQDPLGILLIVRAGETLKVTNESFSDFSVNVKVRGFLVDDLDYQ